MEVSADAVDGEVKLEKLLLAMNDGVRGVFQAHAWGRAFTANGFGVHQAGVRRKNLDAMEMSASFSAFAVPDPISSNLARWQRVAV